MSLRVLHEVARHPSPESFITEFLIPAIKQRVLPPLPHKIELEVSGRVAKVREVLFACEGKRIVLSIGRTVKPNHVEEPTSRRGGPYIQVGAFSRVLFDDHLDYFTAEQQLGTQVDRHPISGTETHMLNLPATIASHWKGKLKMISTRRGNALLVHVDKPVFQQLEQTMELDVFSRRLLTVLEHLEGKLSPARTRAHLSLRNEESQGEHPVATFLKTHGAEIGLAKQIAPLRTDREIAAVLFRRFGADERVNFYAGILAGFLRHPNGRKAMKSLLEFSGYSNSGK